MKWRAHLNTEDKDLSLCGRSCSNIFGIQDSNKAKIKGTNEIMLLDIVKNNFHPLFLDKNCV